MGNLPTEPCPGLDTASLLPEDLVEEVSRIIPGMTNVWASDHAYEQIKSLLSEKEGEALVKKLIGFAQAGFWDLPDNIVRHEGTQGGGHVWRIAYKNSSLFRLVGFFETDARRDFIILDAFEKASGDSYSKAQRDRMKRISAIKRDGEKAWRKRNT